MKSINPDTDLPRIKYIEQNAMTDKINLMHGYTTLKIGRWRIKYYVFFRLFLWYYLFMIISNCIAFICVIMQACEGICTKSNSVLLYYHAKKKSS